MYILQGDALKDVNGGTNDIAVGGTSVVVYTKAHKIGAGTAFSLWILLKCASGNPNVKIEMQVSMTAPAAKEGIADATGTDWCIQEGGTAIFTGITDKVLHMITLTPTPCQYVRFVLTPGGGNQSDTTLQGKIVTQQQLGR